MGSAPVTGATNVMSVQIGEKRAKELSFLCRRYTAGQALEMGLVNEVVGDDELEDHVAGLVRGDRRAQPALPRDREGQLEYLVEQRP